MRPLSRGGMGVVYVAVQTGLGRTVALKVCPGGPGTARFLREARVLSKLRHPNIPRVYDVGLAGEDPYLAMELIEGPTLAERIARRDLSIDEAVRVVEVVARALGHAHEQGVLHRDVKPENVVFDPEGTPYLIDFGLAALAEGADALTKTNEILGTVPYLSPEHLRGKAASLDQRTDLYALGVTLFHAATGCLPYPAGSIFELADLFRAGHRPDPRNLEPRIGRELARVLARSIALDPGDRYPSAADFARDLRAVREGRSAVAERLVPRVRARPGRRRAAAIAVALGALGSGALLAARSRDPADAPAAATEARAPADLARPGGTELLRRAIERQEREEGLAGALADLDAALSLEPDGVRILAWRGDVRRRLGDWPGAEADLERALRIDPRDGVALYHGGLLRLASGDLEGATGLFERLVELEKDHVLGWIRLAECDWSRNDLDSALRRMDRAIAAAPEAIEPLDYRVFLRREQAQAIGGKEPLRQALPDLDRLVELRPDRVEFRNLRGVVRYQLEDFAGSIADIERALQIDPAVSSVWIFYAEVLHRAGRRGDALAALRSALERAEDGDMGSHIETLIANLKAEE